MGPPVTRRPTGSEAARGSGGASASWMLFMKLSSEVSVGTPVCLAAHWVPQNEAPSALGLTEGPRKSRAGAKHTTHHSPQGHSETSQLWGEHETASIVHGVSNVLCPL